LGEAAAAAMRWRATCAWAAQRVIRCPCRSRAVSGVGGANEAATLHDAEHDERGEEASPAALYDAVAADLRETGSAVHPRFKAPSFEPQLPDACVGDTRVHTGKEAAHVVRDADDTEATALRESSLGEPELASESSPEGETENSQRGAGAEAPKTPSAEGRAKAATKAVHTPAGTKGVTFSSVEEYSAEQHGAIGSVVNPSSRANGSNRSAGQHGSGPSSAQPSANSTPSASARIYRGHRSDLSREPSRDSDGMQDLDAPGTPKLSQRLFRAPSSVTSKATRNLDVEYSIKRLDSESLAERQQTMRNFVAREPVIVRAPLGQSAAKDIVALLHNALRLEVKDLYRILTSMSMRSQDLTVRDFSGLFEWWWLFKRLALQILIAEEEVIFRYVESRAPIEQKSLKAPQREADRRVLVLLMGRVDDVGDQYISGLIGVDEQDLFRKLEAIAMALLDYMQSMDSAIPSLLAKIPGFNGREKHAMERRAMKALTRSPTQEALFFVLRGNELGNTSWTRSRVSRARLISANLKHKRYTAHLAIVQDFVDRLSAYRRMLSVSIPLMPSFSRNYTT